MRSATLLIVLAWLAVLGLCSPGCQGEDIRDIKNTAREFDAACEAHDGAKAVTLLHDRSFGYFDTMVHHARTMKPQDINALSWAERYLVLSIRHELTPEELKKADGRAYLKNSIDKGYWHGEDDSDPNDYLTSFKVKKEYATAKFRAPDGSASKYSYYFYRDEKGWKLDFSRGLDMNGMWIDLYCAETGRSPEWVVLKLIELNTGRAVPDGIMNPPR